LRFDAGANEWTWTDGDSGITETYTYNSPSGDWRVGSRTDQDGNSLTYTYDNQGLISLITDANGESTHLIYNTTSRQLEQVDLVTLEGTTTRVRYGYDSNGRLQSVTTDLSPEDNSIADGHVFTSTYTYDGTSTRIASISNTDGTQVSFTYDALGRVETVVDALGQTSSFEYQGSQAYTAQANDTWSSIAQSVYGDASLGEQVKQACIDPVAIDAAGLSSYDPNQDQPATGSVLIEDQGATLHMTGNRWQKLDFPYSITADTILEFDFSAPVKGEIHGIGFDNTNGINPGRMFHLYGTQTWGLSAFSNYSGSGTVHYRIPVGQFFTGSMQYLIFCNDHDISAPNAESLFSNIKVYEDSTGPMAGQTLALPASLTDCLLYTSDAADE